MNRIFARAAMAMAFSLAVSPAKAQTPPLLYGIWNNTNLLTINATNAQVLQTNLLAGVPNSTGWYVQNLTWSPRDAVFYALGGTLNYPILDTYLVRIEPGGWEVKTNAHLGSFNFNSNAGELYEAMTYADSLPDLVVSHRSGTHGLSSDQLYRLATNGAVSLLVNNGQDNDFLAYDSHRDLPYLVDSGNTTVPGVSNMFARISLTATSVQPLRFFKNAELAVCAYHRGLDAFFVSYVTNGVPGLYRWTTDGSQNVTETYVGPISGLNPADTLSALAPVPQPPVVEMKSPLASTQEVCVAKNFGLTASVTQGSGPVKVVTYHDGAAAIGSSTNRDSSFAINVMLAPGPHLISAQAFDGFLSATSQPQALLLAPPAPNRLAAQLSADGAELLCCLGGTISNENYVIQSATNLVNGATSWRPWSTNRAVSELLVFTNAPVEPKRFYRAMLPPVN